MIPPLFALFSWPIVVAFFYRRFDLVMALMLSVIGAYLILPNGVNINLPVLPTFNKVSVASLAAFAFAFLALRKHLFNSRGKLPKGVLPGLVPRHPLMIALMALMVLGAFLTPVFNRDTMVFGVVRIPGMGLYDSFSQVMVAGLTLLPLLLARKYLGHPDAQKRLLLFLAIAGGIYMLPALFEIRMSPQLSNWVYGVGVRDWIQQKRDGGFRPVVFLEHSLWTGIFFASTTIAAFGVWRAGLGQRPWLFFVLGCALFVTIFLSKTTGAFLLVLVVAPIVIFLPTGLQMLAAACIGLFVITYPVARSVDIVPVNALVNLAGKISEERANSLSFRFANETELLDKAMQRPLFGWGGWGRSRIYDENGNDVSVTDGRWVIQMGQGGFVRYVSSFGLLAMPMILLALGRRRYGVDPATAGLCLALCVNLVDLLPNAGLTPVTWIMAGALLGRLEALREQADEPEDDLVRANRGRMTTGPRETIDIPRGQVATRVGPSYTRFAHRPVKRKT